MRSSPVQTARPFPERALVEPLPDRGRGVLPPYVLTAVVNRGRVPASRRPEMTRLVDRDGERQPRAVVADDEHGPGWDILPWNYPVEVDQRQAFLHREAQPAVVGVVRVRTTVSVPQQVVGTEGVVIRPVGRGRDGERRAGQHLRLEDALRRDQRYAAAAQHEPLGEQGPRQHVAEGVDLRSEPLEGGVPNRGVPVAIEHAPARRTRRSAATAFLYLVA